MTSDFTSNNIMMMALNSFTNNSYRYQNPAVTASFGSYADMSNMSSIFNRAVALANAANMGNYMGALNGNYTDISLSTPAWLQQIGQSATSSLNFNFNQALMNPFPAASNSGAVTPAGVSTNSELAQELRKYGITATGDEAKDKKALENAKAKAAQIKKEAASIAEELYDAMKGAGTKNDKLQAAIDKINKDNVIEVMDAWDSSFADSMDGESLIEAIQGEHHTGWFGNTQEKQESAILKALTDRAEDETRGLDLDSEAAAARAKVNSEHDAMFTSDETVRTSIENLAKKIKEKESGTPSTT